jgi:hypothetical protein
MRSWRINGHSFAQLRRSTATNLRYPHRAAKLTMSEGQSATSRHFFRVMDSKTKGCGKPDLHHKECLWSARGTQPDGYNFNWLTSLGMHQ